jgi:hypothetical protein
MAVAAFDRAHIGLDKAKRRDRQSQEIGGDLREAGLVALAVRLGAEHQRDAAVGLEADLGALTRRAARGFEKARDAEAAQPAARDRLAALGLEPVRQQPLRDVVEIGGEAAAIDRDAEALR